MSAAPWMSSIGTGWTRPMSLPGSVSRGSEPRLRAATSNSLLAMNQRSGPGDPVRHGRDHARRHRLGDDRDDPWSWRRQRCARLRRIGVGGRQRPVAEDRDGLDRGDATHRRAEHRHPLDAPLAEPGQCTGDVLDLEHAERRRGIRRPAMPAEIETEHARRPAQERAVLDEVRGDRARVPVQQQDGLVGLGRPAVLGLDRKPACGQPHAVARLQTDDLATERVEGRSERRLLRPDTRCRDQALGGAATDRPNHGRRDGGRTGSAQQSAVHPIGATSAALASIASNTIRLHVSR